MMASDISDEDRDRKLRQFLLARLFGLVAVVEPQRKPEEVFPIASGVTIEAGGFVTLVTVAHFLESVKKWKDGGRLLQLALIIHHENGGSATATLDLSKSHIFCNEGIDIGLVVPEDDVVEKVIKYGGKAVRPDRTVISGEVPDRFLLVGHVSQRSRLATDTIAIGRRDGIDTEWRSLALSNLAVAFVSLQLVGHQTPKPRAKAIAMHAPMPTRARKHPSS